MPATGADQREHGPDGHDPQDQRDHLQVVRGSIWFVFALSILSLGGLAYWSVATQLAEADFGSVAGRELISRAGFLFTAVVFVNYASNLGLPVAVARFGPAGGRAVNALFGWALLFTTASSLVGTVAFFAAGIVLFPDENTAPMFGIGVVPGLLLFFALVTGQSMAVLVEMRLVTLRQWGWVVGRVVAVVLVRFPLFLVPGLRETPVGLLVIMFGPPALSGFIGAIALRRWGSEWADAPLRPVPDEWRVALRFASVNYVATLAAQAPQFMIPLVVSRYEPFHYGAFYLAWTITTVVFLVPHATSQTVLAEASRDRAHVDHQARLGLAVSGAITVGLALGAYLLAAPVTERLFGADYGLTAEVLPRMVAAGIPFTVTAILLARVRVLLLSTATVIITAAFALCTLVPATVMAAVAGVPGAANAWLVGNVVAATVAGVVTLVTRGAVGVDKVRVPETGSELVQPNA